ncbi:mucin-2-like isoform X2 [Sardina pilchardus]|uniref:mucin-2-like isoform X2 n=1 Tax=Sardina pilchardus TaxID=27697 RepID=UPI002E0F637C
MLLRDRLSPLLWTLYLTTLYACGCLGQLDVCGRPPLNSRIAGGQDAPAGSWPWQASLHASFPGFSTFICGGSLINEQWVLSAAHCFNSVSASNLEVYLGRQNQEGSNPNEVKRTVSQIINHPSFNRFTFDNDIALLHLNAPVTFTDYIRPVCLAANGSVFLNGTDSWVTGWGNTADGVPLPSPKTLKEVEVPVVENTQCQSLYQVVPFTVTDNMMCAGDPAGGRDSCEGDSGGPLVSKQDSVWVQSGIVALEGCKEPNRPGVYTRVSRYESWINSEISTNQPGFVQFIGSPLPVIPLTTPGGPETGGPTSTTTPPSPAVTVAPGPTSTTTPPSPALTVAPGRPTSTTTPPSPALIVVAPGFTSTSVLQGDSTASIPASSSSSQPVTQSSTITTRKTTDAPPTPTTTSAATATTTTTTTTTTSPPGRFCRPQDIDAFGFAVVTVTADQPALIDAFALMTVTASITCNSTYLQTQLEQAIQQASKLYEDPTFNEIKQINATCQNNTKLEVIKRFNLNGNDSICFPDNRDVMAITGNRRRNDKVIINIEKTIDCEVLFRTDLQFEDCETRRGDIIRVINDISRIQYGPLIYRRTIIICRRVVRGRTKREVTAGSMIEMQQAFDPDSTSDSSSRSSSPTFPTKQAIRAMLGTAAGQLNITLNETSITFTNPPREESLSGTTTSVTSGMTADPEIAAPVQTTTCGSPGLQSVFSCLAMVLVSLQLMVQWMAL